MSIIRTISAGKGSVCVSNDVLKIEVYRYTISQRYENIDSFPSSLAFRGKDHVVCPTPILINITVIARIILHIVIKIVFEGACG